MYAFMYVMIYLFSYLFIDVFSDVVMYCCIDLRIGVVIYLYM